MNLIKPFIQLPYSFNASRIAEELENLENECWMEHPSRLNGNSAVPLISLAGEDNDEFSGAMHATKHLKKCEYTQQVMASFGELLGRSRFMKLAAGAEVSPHVDFNYHWYNRVRIHIPVVTNPEVAFYCGTDQVHMAAGECWIFDSWRRHNVINRSNQDRVHLVIDTCGSSRFWQTVRRASEGQFSVDVNNINSLEHVIGFTPRIKTEKFNVSPVMAPGELEAIANELISDFSRCPENDSAVVQEYADLLTDLAKDWREVWLEFGMSSNGFNHFRALLQHTRNSLRPNPRALITASNGVGVNPIIVQRILRAALFEELRDDFISA